MIPETISLKLLGLTALAGEFPSASLSRLVGEGRYKEKVITDLKAKKLLKVYNRDGVRAYRLMLGGKRYLLQENPARYEAVLAAQTQSRQDLPHRIRQHQMCEVLLAMQKVGVPIYADEKADIFGKAPSSGEVQTGIPLPAYYTSLEVKGSDQSGTKIKNARFHGILLTENRIYLVYNTGNSIMRWEQGSEIKTRALMTYLLCQKRLSDHFVWAEVQAILMGTDMEIARKILSATHPRSACGIKLDRTFEHFHFIPGNQEGDFLLQLLCSEDLKARLYATLSEGLCPADPKAPIENDGFEEDGTPVLFAFDGDIQRLQNFIGMLQLREATGHVICFDFQADVFREYCGSHAQLQTIDLEKLKRQLLPPEEVSL